MAKKATGSASRKRATHRTQRKRAAGSAKRLAVKPGDTGALSNVFTGMIKPTEEDDEAIMFARAGGSSNWVKIPNRHIEDIQLLDTVHSDGDACPLVHLYMKEPESIEGKTFAALAKLHKVPSRTTATTLSISRTPNARAGNQRQPGSTPCYWDWGLNRWVCP
jgi:hypothetical protein